MNLAIVDIDGTLTKTTDIDAECYLRVVSAFLGHSFSADWSAYLNVTDSGSLEARLKLEAAGLPTDLPLASANDSHQRAAIVPRAIECAAGDKLSEYRIALVGDAKWDLETARHLKLPFVGIASGDRAEQLRTSGATHVFPDFSNLESIFAALGTAGVP